MIWDEAQDRELMAYYRSLITLRHDEPVLTRGQRQSLFLGSDVVAYQRSWPERSLAILMNLSTETKRMVVPGSWSNILLSTHPGGHFASGEGSAEVELPGRAGVVLE